MEDEVPKIRILVLDRGYVIVCKCLPPTNYALWLPVTNSRTIRVWGTSEGLGELIDGPVGTSTKLDRMIPEETIPVEAIIRVIEASQEGWSKHLEGKKVSRAAAG